MNTEAQNFLTAIDSTERPAMPFNIDTIIETEAEEAEGPVMLTDALGSPLRLPAEGSSLPPRVGDAWVVSTDGHDQGLVLIAATRPMHVLAWPVTNPSPDAAAPAFTVEVPELGPMVAWPDAEFGLSMAALDRRLGEVLDDRAMREARWAVAEDDLDADFAWCPQQESPASSAAFEAVCTQAWALGEWA